MSTHPFIAVSFLVTFEKKGSPLEGKTGQGRGLDNAPLKIGEYNFANRLSCQVLSVTNGVFQYTAISRKVVEKHVPATIPKGNMGYDQYTVPDICSTLAVEPTFVAFL